MKNATLITIDLAEHLSGVCVRTHDSISASVFKKAELLGWFEREAFDNSTLIIIEKPKHPYLPNQDTIWTKQGNGQEIFFNQMNDLTRQIYKILNNKKKNIFTLEIQATEWKKHFKKEEIQKRYESSDHNVADAQMMMECFEKVWTEKYLPFLNKRFPEHSQRNQHFAERSYDLLNF